MVGLIAISLLLLGFLVRSVVRGATFGALVLSLLEVAFVYLVYLSYKGIKVKMLAPDAGLKTSIDSYREYFEWERRHVMGAFMAVWLILAGIAIGAVRNWSQAQVFPAHDVVQFAMGDVLIGILTLVARWHSLRKVKRESDMPDALERDDR